MRFFVFLLSVSIASVVNAQFQPYYDDVLYPYPYPDYPISDIQPSIDENRFLFQLITSILTTTSTSTTTTTTTCTILVANACAVGRRRRSFLVDEDDIEPSPVNNVEATQLPEMEVSVRNERKANPQVAFWRGSPDYAPYELQSTFGQQHIPAVYNPFFRRPVVAADPRFLLRVTTRTTTITATVTSRSTPLCFSGSAFNQC